MVLRLDHSSLPVVWPQPERARVGQGGLVVSTPTLAKKENELLETSISFLPFDMSFVFFWHDAIHPPLQVPYDGEWPFYSSIGQTSTLHETSTTFKRLSPSTGSNQPTLRLLHLYPHLLPTHLWPLLLLVSSCAYPRFISFYNGT